MSLQKSLKQLERATDTVHRGVDLVRALSVLIERFPLPRKVSVPVGEYADVDGTCECELAVSRPSDGGRYGICIGLTEGKLTQTPHVVHTAWLQCRRELQLHTFGAIPDLIKKYTTLVELHAAAVEATIADAEKMLLDEGLSGTVASIIASKGGDD